MTAIPDLGLVTIEEAADALRISRWTLRRLHQQGKGPRAIRVGGKVFYRRADLEAFIAEQGGDT